MQLVILMGIMIVLAKLVAANDHIRTKPNRSSKHLDGRYLDSNSEALRDQALVHVYMVAKNEQVLLPYAISHYRTRFPGCPITIFDNNSTDRTREIALSHGCIVLPWVTSQGIQDDFELIKLKNTCWKNFVDGHDAPWVIVADVDEWLDIWQEDLEREDSTGTMIIRTEGFAALGESRSQDLRDIDLHTIHTGAPAVMEYVEPNKSAWWTQSNIYSKYSCFKRGRGGLTSINYSLGAHAASPVPSNATLSTCCYVLKHMNALGRPYLVEKHRQRHAQAVNSCKHGLACHYTSNATMVVAMYNGLMHASTSRSYAKTSRGNVRLNC